MFSISNIEFEFRLFEFESNEFSIPNSNFSYFFRVRQIHVRHHKKRGER